MWKPQEVYKNSAEFEKNIRKFKKLVHLYSDVKTDIHTAPNLLYVLKLELKMDNLLNSLFKYIMIKKETSPLSAKGIINKETEIDNLTNIFISDSIDFEQTFLSFPKSRKSRLLATKKLKQFHPRLKQVIDGKRKSPIKVQKLIGMMDSIIDSVPLIYSNIINKHIYFQDIKLKDTTLKIDSKNIMKLETSKNRNIRKKVYRSKRLALNSTSESFTRNLESLTQYSLISAKSEKNKSIIEYTLEDDLLKEKQFNSVISTSLKNKPVVEKYLELLKKEANIPSVYSYDLAFDPHSYKINEKDLFPLIYESFSYFENSSTSIINDLRKTNHIYIETKPKTFIPYVGFCQNFASDSNAHPYVFCYYQNDLESAMTVAHETGHAIHQTYLNKNNDRWNRDTSLIIHETASYTHELMFLLNLLNTANKTQKKKILFKMISYYFSSLYKKSFNAKFEKHLYKQKQNLMPLIEKNLCKKYSEMHDEFYCGIVNKNPLTDTEWIGNQRLSWQFYELKYVIGFSLASKIAFEIYHGNQEYIEKFNELMTMGYLENTSEFFKLFGLKYNKIEDVVQEAYDQMDSLIEEFQQDNP